MKEINTEIMIDATPEKTWKVLMDFSNWKDWNPIVASAEGAVELGSNLMITMKGKDGKNIQKYSAKITRLDPPHSFSWTAKMGAGFLFTNQKVFEVLKTDKGTKLIHREIFSGLMANLFWGKMEKFVPVMLDSMNMALKNKIEKESQ